MNHVSDNLEKRMCRLLCHDFDR